ncbi:O-antigen ligase family protein [Nitratireductor sp. GISD-1A_MAKvit]|uniref:O-antigen ligase family protein n=1 Tax=Nitratireductor sp. GISD-1A_MAKvit TaxID=3234198 RepID=UPI00346532E5
MNYRTTNRLFTLGAFSLPPVLGSVTSVVWHGGALWCVFEVLSKRRRLSPDRAMRWLAALMLVYIAANIAAFLAGNPSWALAYKLLPLATFLLFPFSYSIWTISDRQEVAHAVLLGCTLASFGALVLALIQYGYLGLRAEGGAGNALVFADVACLAGLSCLAGALILDDRRVPVLLFAFMAAFCAVIMSGSRSVWGVMIVLTLIELFVFRKRVMKVIRGRVLALVGMALIIVVLTSGLIVDRFETLLVNLDRLTQSADYSTSVGLRVALWETGLKLFAERPILGYGLQNTSDLIRQILHESYGLDVSFTHFHNGFLTILVEGGIVAGGAIVAMFALITFFAIRALSSRNEPVTRLGGMILLVLVAVYAGGGSVNIVFGHDILDTVFMMFLIVGLYLSCGTSRLPDAQETVSARN